MSSRLELFLVGLCLSTSVHAQSIFTVAGGGTDDGRPATVATIYPGGLALDDAGDVYLVDHLGFRVRKVSVRTGLITTVAGGTSGSSGDGGPATAASLSEPSAIAFDKARNLYIADTLNSRIRKVAAGTGIITTVAGTGHDGFSGDGGPATAAVLSLPIGVAVDAAGNLYIADNNRVRKVSAATGIITTVAGNGATSRWADDGPATQAALGPSALAIDTRGNLYIVDSGNHRIRKVTVATGMITTAAGNGFEGFSGDGGPATAASLNFSYGNGIALDSSDNLYFSDGGNYRIRKVSASTGLITTVAGSPSSGFSGDGGPATAAALRDPSGVAVDRSGNVYIADSDNGRIRKVAAATGLITTWAGRGFSARFGDGGPATAAPLGGLRRVALDGEANLYFSEGGWNRIRKVGSSSGIITTVAGSGSFGSSGDGDLATKASLYTPDGLAIDVAGNVYIADRGNSRIRKVTAATGIITTVAGNGTPGFSGDGGPASAASLKYSEAIVLDGAGNLYVADTYNHRIRRISSQTGIITTVAGGGSTDLDGFPATATELSFPADVALDRFNNLYIAEGNRVRKVNAATGIITTVAGTGMEGFWGDGGAATAAGLKNPRALALDTSGHLYIADELNLRIRKVNAASGIITTVVGGGKAFGDAGPATATILRPGGVAVDSLGNLYVTDMLSSRIRAVFACVKVASPAIVSPAADSTGLSTSPRLAWTSVRGAFRYDILLDTVSPPSRFAASDISTTTFAPSNLQPLTKYYWQVIAKGDPFCVPFSQNTSEARSFTTAASCDVPDVVVAKP